MTVRENRIFYLDEIRAIAILLVTLAHTIQFFPINMNYLTSPTLLSYLSVARMGVPLFFMLSGALLIGKEYSLSVFFKKRFSRVLIPVIFWRIIFLILFLIASGFTYSSFMDGLYSRGISWFIFAIIGVYLVIPIFNSFINEYGMDGVKYCLLIWIMLVVLKNVGFSNNYYFEIIFNNFGLYVGYAILGYYLCNRDFNIYALPMSIFNLAILIVCIVISIYYAFNFHTVFYIHSISVIIQCSALFLFLRYVSKYAMYNKNKILSRAHNFIENSFIGYLIFEMSICSFTMFLMHKISIDLLLIYYPITTLNLIPISFMLMVGITFAISLVLSKIPVVNRLCGIY